MDPLGAGSLNPGGGGPLELGTSGTLNSLDSSDAYDKEWEQIQLLNVVYKWPLSCAFKTGTLYYVMKTKD